MGHPRQDQPAWEDLLRRFETCRGGRRPITFQELSGQSEQLELEAGQKLSHVKQLLLERVAHRLPEPPADKKRSLQLFDGSVTLGDDLMVAMIPDQVSVVYNLVDDWESSSGSSLGSSLGDLFG